MNASPERSATSPQHGLFWGIGRLVGALYLSVAGLHVAYASMNIDESFYAAGTRAVCQGEVAYRDFGFTQPPLVAYINAPFLRLFGFGLFQPLSLNGLWGFIAALLTARLVGRRAGRWGMLVARTFAPAYSDTESVIFARPHLLPANPTP